MGTAPDLSVIVVTHNGSELARATLRSARARSGDLSLEWLVVDSGSSDGTADDIELEWPEIEVIRRPNIGFAAANNVALARAAGRYVLLLNPDVELVRGTLQDVVIALDARPDVGAASVVQRAPDGAIQPTIRRFPSALRQLGEAFCAERLPALRRLQEPETRMALYEREASADWLVGAFLAVRSSALRDVGPLDERFFLYSEETDWCYRLKRAGWDIRHLPFVEVVHHGGGYARPELAAQLSYSKLLFARKHFGRARGIGMMAALTLRHALRATGFAVLATVRPAARARARAERRALAVAVGRERPSLGTG